MWDCGFRRAFFGFALVLCIGACGAENAASEPNRAVATESRLSLHDFTISDDGSAIAFRFHPRDQRVFYVDFERERQIVLDPRPSLAAGSNVRQFRVTYGGLNLSSDGDQLLVHHRVGRHGAVSLVSVFDMRREADIAVRRFSRHGEAVAHPRFISETQIIYFREGSQIGAMSEFTGGTLGETDVNRSGLLVGSLTVFDLDVGVELDILPIEAGQGDGGDAINEPLFSAPGSITLVDGNIRFGLLSMVNVCAPNAVMREVAARRDQALITEIEISLDEHIAEGCPYSVRVLSRNLSDLFVRQTSLGILRSTAQDYEIDSESIGLLSTEDFLSGLYLAHVPERFQNYRWAFGLNHFALASGIDGESIVVARCEYFSACTHQALEIGRFEDATYSSLLSEIRNSHDE